MNYERLFRHQIDKANRQLESMSRQRKQKVYGVINNYSDLKNKARKLAKDQPYKGIWQALVEKMENRQWLTNAEISAIENGYKTLTSKQTTYNRDFVEGKLNKLISIFPQSEIWHNIKAQLKQGRTLTTNQVNAVYSAFNKVHEAGKRYAQRSA